MPKNNLVSRNEIANMLKQYQSDEISEAKISRTDIDFIKSLLLPVKAKMIQGLQTYDVKRHIEYDEYQYKAADGCIKSICDDDLKWALKWFTSIYDCRYFSLTYCSYSELVVGVLLISNMIRLSDRLLAEMDKSALVASASPEKNLIQNAVSDMSCINDLDHKIAFWHNYCSEFSLKEYFGLTDSEDVYVRKSLMEAFRAIVVCRKNNLSIEAYVEKIQEKISCFFSALGAPSRLFREGYETKRRLNLHETSKN